MISPMIRLGSMPLISAAATSLMTLIQVKIGGDKITNFSMAELIIPRK
jgi:hypothetical protein